MMTEFIDEGVYYEYNLLYQPGRVYAGVYSCTRPYRCTLYRVSVCTRHVSCMRVYTDKRHVHVPGTVSIMQIAVLPTP
jgi:hypothetical protein